jgi:hypothetical protein
MATSPAYPILQDGLLYQVDLANAKCWDPTKPEIVKPLPISGEYTLLETIDLPDYGLTGTDTGACESLSDGLTLRTGDGMRLVAHNYPYLGGPEYITPSGTTTAGKFASLTVSYFASFFKLHDQPFEVLPVRYGEGVTLETSIYVSARTLNGVESGNTGIFLYLGTRAENKFYDTQLGDAAHYTSTNIDLGPDHPKFPERGVEGNVLAFRINGNGQLGYRRITDDLEIEEEYSLNQLSAPGWVSISLAFTPCYPITDPDLLECAPRRDGVLRVYVNGGLFHEFLGFQEPMFKALSTEPEKQLGVPYTLSWGGGSPGLRNQFHWSGTTSGVTGGTNITAIVTGGTQLLIEEYFDGQLYGCVQTLRIYQKPLNALDVRQNYNHFALRYGLPQLKGGRAPAKIAW